MVENYELTPEEQWQKAEDERLEYEGYCNKIRQGLESLDERSGERAVWELVQNARDMCKNDSAHIKIELTDKEFIFTHHGKEFDYTSFRALVKQDSSKDRNNADLVGQYGTGFMTTHAFNRMVYVSGPYTVRRSKEEISGYVQIKDFQLDRTMVDTAEGPSRMKEQLDNVKKLCKQTLHDSILDDATSFRYELTSDQVTTVSDQLSDIIRLMPFVLIINDRIQDVEIYDHKSNIHIIMSKSHSELPIAVTPEGWFLHDETIISTSFCDASLSNEFHCKSLKSDKGDVVILPPFPKECGNVKDIPSLFLWFPLLGTEAFGVNFIFHSKRFHPVEKRNNIMLPGSTMERHDKGCKNEVILNEMVDVLLSFFANEENAKTLSLGMCEVAFPLMSDDEETLRFYKELQAKWVDAIPYWRILPIGETNKCIADSEVKLLHPDFYKLLNAEQRVAYEGTLLKYALLPKRYNNESYLMPSTGLIAWSEVVDRWGCKRDSDFFISVADVCNAIKEKKEDLIAFLQLMVDSGNEKVMEVYPLLPNRKGELRKKGDLYHGDFMSDEVYNLVKELMGEDVNKIYDTAYKTICLVGSYTQEDLFKAISATMTSWRNSSLSGVNKSPLSEEKLNALIKFCSASSMAEFVNQRGRMMPILVQFYGKTFDRIAIAKMREDEEDFYKSAFNLLLDYTLYQISLKDKKWVAENKNWLLEFLIEYTSSKEETRAKRLNDYGVIPNCHNQLCKKDNLHKNNGVPPEMATIYNSVFGKDLYEGWVDSNFECIVKFEEDSPVDIANKIETSLVIDMKQDIMSRKFSKVVRDIIIWIGKSKEWEGWFGQINDKKATYTFSMKSGKAQESLFSLMDIEDCDLDRLAKLSASGSINQMLDKMEHQMEIERDNEVRFNHQLAIGKHIEEVLRQMIDKNIVQVENPSLGSGLSQAEDVQNGQDIIVKVKTNDGWKDVFYIEVKSKWDFKEPAHMSTRQIRMAVLHPDQYALCCVDLRPYKTQDLLSLSEEIILCATKVKMDIGSTMAPMVSNILAADEASDDVQVKLSDYRSNISAAVFSQGEPIDALLKRIESVVSKALANR